MTLDIALAVRNQHRATIEEALAQLRIVGEQTCRCRDSGNFDAAARDLKRVLTELKSVHADEKIIAPLSRAIDLLRIVWAAETAGADSGNLMIAVVLVRAALAAFVEQQGSPGAVPLDKLGVTA